MLNEEGDKAHGHRFIFDRTRFEQGGLLEIDNFILDARDIDATRVNHGDDFIGIASFELLEELSD